MTLHGAFSARAGLDWEPPKPVETDPLRALEQAASAARAASHCKKLEAAQRVAFDAWGDAFKALVAHARASDRKIAQLQGRLDDAPRVHPDP